jgi:flagellar basal-body rod modification protein FlgD
MDALESLQIESIKRVEADKKAAEDAVGQTDFLEMLVAQLENQDPLNPQDSAQFAAQLAQFSSVEQLIGVRAGIDELVAIGNGRVIKPENLDPTNLVGKDVVVFGSQIEVGAERDPVTMPFRTIATASSAEVTIRDSRGQVVHQERLNPINDETGGFDPLPPGDHDFTLDAQAENLPPGVYSIEFEAVGPNSQEVTILPMVEGRVTGAILVGTPGIRIGDTVFPVSDVLEVKEARGEG